MKKWKSKTENLSQSHVYLKDIKSYKLDLLVISLLFST